MWHSTMTCLFSAAYIWRINRPACIAKGTASKTDRWIGIILSQSLLVWRHYCVGQNNQLFWHGSFIVKGIVDGHHVGQSRSRMSLVFNVTFPSPSRRSLPFSVSSVPTLCGWSVCLRTQADTDVHRGIQSDRHQLEMNAQWSSRLATNH